MKLFAAVLLFITCASISAQDQEDHRVHFACMAVTPTKLLKCQTTLELSGIRLIGADRVYTSPADFARHAHVGDPWWPTGTGTVVLTLAASDIRQEQNVDRLTGSSEIHTTTMDLYADDAVYHTDSGEIEARGNVRVKPVAAP